VLIKTSPAAPRSRSLLFLETKHGGLTDGETRERARTHDLDMNHVAKPLEDHERRPEPLVAVKEAAAFLGVQPGTVYLWAETGRIPSYKIETLRRFRLSDLETLVQDHRVGPSQMTPSWRPQGSKRVMGPWQDPADKRSDLHGPKHEGT